VNIVYSVHTFPKLSESFVLNEIHELERRGHNVAVFAMREGDESIRHTELDGLEADIYYAGVPSVSDAVTVLSSPVMDKRVLSRAFFPAWPHHHAYYLYLASELCRFVDRLDWAPDVIHGHFAIHQQFAMTYAAERYGTAATVTAHAYEIFHDPDRPTLARLFDRMDRVIAPSEYNKRYLLEELDVEVPIDIVPATTSVDKFQPGLNEVENRLLTVGRLTEKKGIRDALEAVSELSEAYPTLSYHVVGTGEEDTALKRHVDQLGIADSVEFLGNVSDDRLLREYDEASVFVLPCVIAANGDRDVMPVVLKEAMAMETPCVSTTVSAIPELIEDGTNGLLVPPHDPDSLARAIRSLLDGRDLRERLGGAGRHTVERKFDISICVDALETTFERAATGY